MATKLAESEIVSARIEHEQREQLERMAVEQDRTLSYLLRQAVDQFLREPQRPKP